MRIPALLALLAVATELAACAGPPDQPQSHVGTCSHYQSAVREEEDVPNCELRGRHTLINGLPPIYPGNHA